MKPKRIISILLALVMVLSFVPIMAFAVDYKDGLNNVIMTDDSRFVVELEDLGSVIKATVKILGPASLDAVRLSFQYDSSKVIPYNNGLGVAYTADPSPFASGTALNDSNDVTGAHRLQYIEPHITGWKTAALTIYHTVATPYVLCQFYEPTTPATGKTVSAGEALSVFSMFFVKSDSSLKISECGLNIYYRSSLNHYSYISRNGAEVAQAGTGSMVVPALFKLRWGPAVTTNTATAIGPAAATLSGTNTASTTQNNNAIVERGFVYSSTNNTPTIGATGTSSATSSAAINDSTLTFTAGLTGLLSSTPYYYRAYTLSKYSEGATPYAGTDSYVYGEIKTFTTDVSPTFSITYNLNGGDAGTGPATETDKDPGTYTLATTPVPTHPQDDASDVLFLGWSAAAEPIVDKDGPKPAMPATVTITTSSVTVYAVWAYDRNENNIPDVDETQYNTIYVVAGGAGGPSPSTISRIPGTYDHPTAIPTHANADLGGVSTVVLFAGWTKVNTSGKIYAAGETVPAYEADVTITDADVTLYAVWGYSTDGTFPPDINRKFNTTYNIGAAGSWGLASPYTIADRVPGTYAHPVEEPTRGNVMLGGVSTVVLFAGWTTDSSADGKIYAAGDTVPARVANVTIINANVNLYAVWGYSTDGTFPPDIDRKWNVYYLDNKSAVGGTSGPGTKYDLLPGHHTHFTPDPTHVNMTYNGVSTVVLFAGWTKDPSAAGKIYAAGETVPARETDLYITNGHLTLYAVWGYSTDGTFPPDIDKKHNTTYNTNSGTWALGSPYTIPDRGPGTYAHPTPNPTHANEGTFEGVSDVPVLFIGWTTDASASGKVYKAGDTPPVTDDNAVITTSALSYFAVWGYDKNKNDIPDVLEDAKSIFFNHNNGSPGTGPQEFANRPNGTYTIASLAPTIPTHADANGGEVYLGKTLKVMFIGWSETKLDILTKLDQDVYTANVVTEVTVSGANATVYAMWSFSSDGINPDVPSSNWFEITGTVFPFVDYDLAKYATGEQPMRQLVNEACAITVDLYKYDSLLDLVRLMYGVSGVSTPEKQGATSVVHLTYGSPNEAESVGQFRMRGVAPGTYLLVINRPGYVPYYVKVTITGGNQNLSNRFDLMPGDVNGDGAVTTTDYSLCAQKIGIFVGSPGYDGKYDLKGLGIVNGLSVSSISAYIGLDFTGCPYSNIDWDVELD